MENKNQKKKIKIMSLIKPFFGFLAGTHASFGVGLAFWVCLCLVLRQRKAMGKKKTAPWVWL